MLKFKPVLSRKLVLSITAGALVTASVIGAGTFAWFTSTADVTLDATFRTGTVATIELTETDAAMYNFYPGHSYSVGKMTQLETDLAYEDVDTNDVFKEWFTTPENKFEFLDAGVKPDETSDDTIALIKNPFRNGNIDGVSQMFTQLTPGSIIEGSFHIDASEYTSAPVYFRLNPAVLKMYSKLEDGVVSNPVTNNKKLTQAAFATIELKETNAVGGDDPTFTTIEINLEQDENGFLYSSVPLVNGVSDEDTIYEVTQVDVSLYAYVSGKNNNDLQGKYLKFDGKNMVEFIQATNNAVYDVAGWKEMANKNFFTPYVDTDVYQKYLKSL